MSKPFIPEDLKLLNAGFKQLPLAKSELKQNKTMQNLIKQTIDGGVNLNTAARADYHLARLSNRENVLKAFLNRMISVLN